MTILNPFKKSNHSKSFDHKLSNTSLTLVRGLLFYSLLSLNSQSLYAEKDFNSLRQPSTESSTELSTRKVLPQVQAFNFDIDDNILFTKAKIWLWNPEKRTEVGFTTSEWALVRDLIGKEEPYKNLILRSDGLRNFDDHGPQGKDEFRLQIQEALADKHKNWRGPSWKAFEEALSHPETLQHTTLITARGHSPESIHAGLKVLLDQGLIPALPLKENIFPVLWSGFPEKYRGASSSESKAKVMLSLLDEIQKIPVPENAAWITNREGNDLAQLHLWGFSDDDYGNFSKALNVLSKEVAAGKWPNIKLVLLFTGHNHPTEKPRAVVILPDGKTRSTQAEEAQVSEE